MSVLRVRPGDLVRLDPSDIRNIAFDHRSQLKSGVTASTVTFTITAIRQSGLTALTKDNEGRLTAAQATIALEETVADDNVVTQLRLNATTATVSDLYEVAAKILTSETIPQTKEQSIQVLINQR